MSPKKLHTFIALREGEKNPKSKALTALHRTSQRADAYEGLTRTYRSHADDGDRLPSENKNIQFNADNVLNGLVTAVSRDWNLMATIDGGNQLARADLKVPTGNGDETTTILEDVPVQFLLYLARELDDVKKFIQELPTLDPSVKWTYDESVAAFVADPQETSRSKKVLQNHIKYPHTDKHPAQVETFTTDVVEGTWTLIRRSGALPLERKAQLLQRVHVLQQSVKEARENAADTEVPDVVVSRPLFDYLLSEDD